MKSVHFLEKKFRWLKKKVVRIFLENWRELLKIFFWKYIFKKFLLPQYLWPKILPPNIYDKSTPLSDDTVDTPCWGDYYQTRCGLSVPAFGVRAGQWAELFASASAWRRFRENRRCGSFARPDCRVRGVFFNGYMPGQLSRKSRPRARTDVIRLD